MPAVGGVLAMWNPDHNERRQALMRRLAGGVFMAALCLLALYVLPSMAAAGLLALLSTAAILEFYSLLDRAGIPSFRRFGVAAGILLIAATFVDFTRPPWMTASSPGTPECEGFVLFGLVLVICVRQFSQRNNDQPLPTIACTLFGILYVPYLLRMMARLAFEWDPVSWGQPLGLTGRALILYLVAVVKASDIGAYAVGSLWGRRKLIPRLSPGKTVEGAVGAFAAGIGTSLGFWAFGPAAGGGGALLGRLVFHLGDAIVLGVLLAGVGMLGDLVESLLKRAGGVKDSGRIIAGLGGILDVLDSLIFTAPLLYYYAHWLLRPI